MDKDETISLFQHDIEVTVDQIDADVDDDKPYPSIGFAVS